MDRKIIRVPSAMYDVWEEAYRDELYRRYPDRDEQYLWADKDTLELGHENFTYQGCIFRRVDE